MKNTRKKIKGGGIHPINGLKYILSIGYEMETATFMKLTESDQIGESGEIVLYNTDTISKDVEEFEKLKLSEDFDEFDEDLISRMEEIVNIPAYNDDNEIDENIHFNITNDISQTPFLKKLKSICNNEIDSNEMYKLRDIDTNQEYKIHFLYKDDFNLDCVTISNVEWIFTYFKPKQSPSIVLDTFINAMKNLIDHVKDMEQINTNFIVNTNNGEFIIDRPEVRTLFNKPNTNLYYFQTHTINKKLEFDNVCFRSQMTFSAKIENIMLVMISLISDNLKSIQSLYEVSKSKLIILNKVKACVDKLIEQYNKNEPVFKMDSTIKKYAPPVKKITGYLQLIIYKLYVYYTEYMMIPKKNRKYFKNSLTFNLRHNNYVLYKQIKNQLRIMFFDELAEMYGDDDDEINDHIAKIIQKLIVQTNILEEYMVEKDVDTDGNVIIKTKLRKNVFNPKNIIEEKTDSYGNPSMSLISYLQFFENPTHSDPENEDGTHDWLEITTEYNTARLKLEDDIVLVEFRSFQNMLSSYVYSIADDELKNMMTNGTCNALTNNFSPDVSGLSIGIYKKFIQLQNQRGGKASLTRNNKTKRRKYLK